MLPESFLAFLSLALVFIVIPGPNVLLIVSTSLTAGRARGLQAVAGTASAMALQLLIVALATSSLLALLNRGLIWLKWLGAAYLLGLGINSLVRFWQQTPAVSLSAAGSLQRGFWVSLTNPKTIFFFSAFLPQFVSDADFYLQQIALLAICFWILGTVCDTAYALLASRLYRLLAARRDKASRIQNGLSGTLYIAASIFLASSHKA